MGQQYNCCPNPPSNSGKLLLPRPWFLNESPSMILPRRVFLAKHLHFLEDGRYLFVADLFVHVDTADAG